MSKRILHLSGLFLLVLAGAGCIPNVVVKTTPEDAAEQTTVAVGTQIVLRETVFGLGGKFVQLFKQESAERRVEVTSWEPGVSARATWTRVLTVQTEASQKAIAAYNNQYAQAPIGTILPEAPEPKYETLTQIGTLASEALVDAHAIHLPLFWEQETVSGEGSSLVWLSKEQYQELVQTRKTRINLGLFDDSVSYAVGLTDQVKNLVERLRGQDDPPEAQSVLEVEANINWGTYTLRVDGTPTVVRTIIAHNAFARYTILANENNPLILEVMISPATRGSLNVFTREALGEAFWGYEVTHITHPSV